MPERGGKRERDGTFTETRIINVYAPAMYNGVLELYAYSTTD